MNFKKSRLVPFETFFSTVLFLVIIFTTGLNAYYWLLHNNIIVTTVVDRFGHEKEWLWGPILARKLNDEMVIDFAFGRDSGQNITKDLRSTTGQDATFTDNCVRKLQTGSVSRYAFCENLAPKLPSWAASFEAILLQDLSISSVEDFKSGKRISVLALHQGYKSNRSMWHQSSSIVRHVCTTEALAKGTTSESTATIYTAVHGVLKTVNCKALGTRNSLACTLISSGSKYVLYKNDLIFQYRVFMSETTGEEYIVSAWGDNILLGSYVDGYIRWPSDCCLYVRRNQRMGWFGLGYVDYKIHISEAALFAKIQLLFLVGIIWYVDNGLSVTGMYAPLIKSSRLGVFGMIVVQIVYAATIEFDIIRTITTWEKSNPSEIVFYTYVLMSTGLSNFVLALGAVRVYGTSWSCRIGNLGGIVSVFVGMLVVFIISFIKYSVHSYENGMHYTANGDCPANYSGCSSRTHFNYCYLSCSVSFFPIILDYLYFLRMNKKKMFPTLKRRGCTCARELTTFEKYCLGSLSSKCLVPDALESTIAHSRRNIIAPSTAECCRWTSQEVISTTGFSAIENLFVIRTKDIYLLVFARLLPVSILENLNQSVIVWPLSENGTVVNSPKRAFLCQIREDSKDNTRGLLKGQTKPLR